MSVFVGRQPLDTKGERRDLELGPKPPCPTYLAQHAHLGFHLPQASCLQVQHAQCVSCQVAHLVSHAGQRLGGEGHGLLQCFALVCSLQNILPGLSRASQGVLSGAGRAGLKGLEREEVDPFDFGQTQW